MKLHTKVKLEHILILLAWIYSSREADDICVCNQGTKTHILESPYPGSNFMDTFENGTCLLLKDLFEGVTSKSVWYGVSTVSGETGYLQANEETKITICEGRIPRSRRILFSDHANVYEYQTKCICRLTTDISVIFLLNETGHNSWPMQVGECAQIISEQPITLGQSDDLSFDKVLYRNKTYYTVHLPALIRNDCGNLSLITPPPPATPKTEVCQDKGNCSFLHFTCDAFVNFSRDFCKKTCGYCKACEDDPACKTFHESICTVDTNFAQTYCPKLCNYCSGDVFFHNNSVTSTLSDVTVPGNSVNLVTSPGNLVFRQCQRNTVLLLLGLESKVTDSRAGMCLDGTHATSEAVPLNLCGTPDPSKWKPGLKVTDNCSRLPIFIPISTFILGNYPRDISGLSAIFLGCELNGIKVATQICGNPLQIKHIQKGSANFWENADNFYTIDWV